MYIWMTIAVLHMCSYICMYVTADLFYTSLYPLTRSSSGGISKPGLYEYILFISFRI